MIYFINPSEGITIYYDLLRVYIDYVVSNLTNFFKGLYGKACDLINIEDSFIDKVKESNNIKNQITVGIKDGVKEALDEVISELQENLDAWAGHSNSDLLKQFALVTSVGFFVYFILSLPHW